MLYLQCAVAAIIPMIVGFLWYGPMLFQNAWMKSLNFTEKDIQGGNMPAIFGIAYVMAFIMSFFISYVVRHDPETLSQFVHGLMHGAMLGVMMAMPVLVSNSLFERKSTKNILINVGYWIVTIALMGGLLGAWR